MKKSTKLYLSLALFLACNTIFAQNAKVVDTPGGTVISNMGGIDMPYSASILDIRSPNKGILLPRMSTGNRDAIAAPQAGLLIYNNTTNQFNYHNGSSWQAASFGNQWGVNGSILHHSGKVGVGTSAMINANTFLTVRGNLGGTNLEGMYVDASSNTGKAFYGYSVNDSSIAYHYYDGGTSKWNLAMNGTDRITVTSTGLVGIGTTNPTNRLYVNGSSYFNGTTEVNSSLFVNGSFDVDNSATINGSAYIDGNATIGGTMTVNNNKGVAYNGNNSNNLRIYRFTTEYYHPILPAHGSAIVNITFGGGFTSTPFVIIGDIDLSGGTAGEIDRLILVLRSCALNTSTGETTCAAKIINTDSSSMDYSVSWNCVAIGY